jgi:hypothetical protein
VVDLAKMLGWKVAWTWNSMHSPKGWPDLFMIRGKDCIAAELKVKGKLTNEQRDWLAALSGAGVPAFCWKPDDWEEIEFVLAREKKVIVELSPYRNGGKR